MNEKSHIEPSPDGNGYNVFDRYGFKCVDITDHYPPVCGSSLKVFYSINSHHIYYYDGINEFYSTFTEKFCEHFNLSEEETLYWVLKYGRSLPIFLEDFDDIKINYGDVGV